MDGSQQQPSVEAGEGSASMVRMNLMVTPEVAWFGKRNKIHRLSLKPVLESRSNNLVSFMSL